MNESERKTLATINVLLRLVDMLVDNNQLRKAKRQLSQQTSWLDYEDDSLLGLLSLTVLIAGRVALTAVKICLALAALIFFGPQVTITKF